MHNLLSLLQKYRIKQQNYAIGRDDDIKKLNGQ